MRARRHAHGDQAVDAASRRAIEGRLAATSVGGMEDIVFLDQSTLPVELRRPTFAHRWTAFEQTKERQVVGCCRDATVIISNKTPLRAVTLEKLPKLRMVAIPATGMDHVDTTWCEEHGIRVTNCPDYSVHGVPEHAISMMMALRRNLFDYHQDVVDGTWHQSGHFCLFTHSVRDLFSATLGIF